MEIGIIDYNAGNLKSVQNAFSKLGVETRIVSEAEGLGKVDGIVLPGVGSFSRSKNLDEMREELLERMEEKPFLGICLGMQLLFEASTESPDKGLGVFRGTLVKLNAPKVPHMGWNNLEIDKKTPLLEGIDENDRFYFVHSYAVMESEKAIALTEYCERFVSAVGEKNVYGLQFHPEKSGEKGLKILENFVSVCKS